jgi:hypothetical protein
MHGAVLGPEIRKAEASDQEDKKAALNPVLEVSAHNRANLSALLQCFLISRLLPISLLAVLCCTTIAHPVMAQGTPARPSIEGAPTAALKENPLKAADTSSPRSTLQSFLENMTLAYKKLLAGESLDKAAIPYYRAKRCLNLSEVAPSVVKTVSVETSIKLKEVLDRVEIPPFRL